MTWLTQFLVHLSYGRFAEMTNTDAKKSFFSLHRRWVLLLGAGLSVALAASCLADPEDEEIATEEGALTSSGVNATVSLTSDWGAGYCANITLANGGSTNVTS